MDLVSLSCISNFLSYFCSSDYAEWKIVKNMKNSFRDEKNCCFFSCHRPCEEQALMFLGDNNMEYGCFFGWISILPASDKKLS